MKPPSQRVRGFTLVELLVVIAIIVVLVALLLPALSAAKARVKRIGCINNAKQVNLAVLLYAHDNAETLPDTYTNHPTVYWFKEQVKSYAGLSGTSSPADTVFLCPAEYASPTFSMPGERPFFDFNCYTLNNRLHGKKTSSVPHPSRTALVTD